MSSDKLLCPKCGEDITEHCLAYVEKVVSAIHAESEECPSCGVPMWLHVDMHFEVELMDEADTKRFNPNYDAGTDEPPAFVDPDQTDLLAAVSPSENRNNG